MIFSLPDPRAAALPLFLLLVGCNPPVTPPPPPPAPVKVVPVVRQEVSQRVELLGTVVPVTTSDVAAGAAGKVVSYPFREGDQIREGDVLAKLRSVTLSIELAAARATLREKQARHRYLASGFRLEERQQAEASMKAALANQQLTESRLRRKRQLYQRNAVNQDELQQAESDAARATEAYAEALALHNLRTTGYRPEEIAEAQAMVEAQEQEVLRLEDERAKRTITAPFAGYLVRQHSDVGQWIEQGGIVATLVDLTEVDVVVNVEESLMHLVRKGQDVEVRFDALAGELHKGIVKDIVPQSDWQGGSRSFPVKVRVPNPAPPAGMPSLKEGMLARILLRGGKHVALLAHKDAIVRSSGQSVVYRLSDEDRAQPIPIAEHLSYGEQIEITGPLEPGDRLVTEGNERLRPAQKVQVLNPPDEKNDAKKLVRNEAEGEEEE